MTLYLVHVNVLKEAVAQWEPYMRDHHIDEVMMTGCFHSALMTRAPERDDQESLAYTMCYIALDQDAFERYGRVHAPSLKQDHATRFEGRVRATREILPILKHFSATTGPQNQ